MRGSIRSKTDRDVAAIAAQMNGGGHKAAAGFTIHGKLPEARAIVEELVAKLFAEQSSAPMTTDAEVTNTTVFTKIREDML